MFVRRQKITTANRLNRYPARWVGLAALLFATTLLPQTVRAQDTTATVHAGISLRKFAGFYWMNGFNLEYRPNQMMKNHFRAGLNLTSSVLGSGMFSKAVPVYCYEVYGQYVFRPKYSIQPCLALNVGYAMADLGPGFEALTASQPLVSAEGGVCLQPMGPVSAGATIGYQVLTGKGTSGLGAIYPVTFQFRLQLLLR